MIGNLSSVVSEFSYRSLDHELARTFQIRIIWRPTSHVQRIVTKS